MADHFQVYELKQGRGLEVHVLTANFGATFFQAVLDVLLLVALVVSQTPDEVVEGFLEPVPSLLANGIQKRPLIERSRYRC